MGIANNTGITLSASSPKKDAVVASPPTLTDAVSDEIVIWAAANVDEALTQSIVGGFEQLFRYAKTNIEKLARNSDPTPLETWSVVHMPIGGSEADIQINSNPTADELRLYVGEDVWSGRKSHLLNRTWKRLRERWLEESK